MEEEEWRMQFEVDRMVRFSEDAKLPFQSFNTASRDNIKVSEFRKMHLNLNKCWYLMLLLQLRHSITDASNRSKRFLLYPQKSSIGVSSENLGSNSKSIFTTIRYFRSICLLWLYQPICQTVICTTPSISKRITDCRRWICPLPKSSKTGCDDQSIIRV